MAIHNLQDIRFLHLDLFVFRYVDTPYKTWKWLYQKTKESCKMNKYFLKVDTSEKEAHRNDSYLSFVIHGEYMLSTSERLGWNFMTL